MLGPRDGSGGTIEGRFGEHCGGNVGIGISKFGVGDGKVESVGGIGGGAFAIRSIVAKDCLGGEGLVVDGGRSPSMSSKDGEDGREKKFNRIKVNSYQRGELGWLSRSGWW